MILKLIFLCTSLTFLTSCEDSEYKKIMEPALKKKLADHNSVPNFYGEEEPPIPTKEEVMKDTKGVDRNVNGIRDDIDIWINRTGENYNEVMALRQKAIALQDFLELALEKRYKDAETGMNKSISARKCLWFIFPSDRQSSKAYSIEERLTALHFLPKERASTSVSFYKHITLYGGGEGGMNNVSKNCTFKIDNFENANKKFIQIYENSN